MAFQSQLGAMRVFDDSNASELVNIIRDDNSLGGYVERDFQENPFGSICPAFSGDLIPRNEWTERIEELERKEATLEHLLEYLKMPILNQDQLPYCWCYGFTGAKMASYGVSGEPIPYLSATSLAAKIKNYQKVGGWAGEAISGDLKFGTSTIDFWPEAQLDRRFDTPEQRADAKLHTVHEYAELPSQSFDAVMTNLMRGHPTTLGLMWWGHLVFATRPVVISKNRFGVVIRNSWTDKWENKGRAVLAEEKATPHEAFSIRTAKRAA